MKKINKHNYEAFFLDYIDGNLSPGQEKTLFDFIKTNPEYNQEFKQLKKLEKIKLVPENINFKNKNNIIKETLKKHFEITKFEYLCIADLEKDINKNETEELLSYTRNNINLKKEYRLFGKTKLKHNPEITYNRKNTLYKTSVAATLKQYILGISAAAAVLLFFFLINFKTKTQNTETTVIAQNKTIKTKPEKIQKNTTPVNIEKKEKTAFVTHNQTKQQTILAFDDKEPQKTNNNINKTVSIPKIKNEALISNTNNTLKIRNKMPEIKFTNLNTNTYAKTNRTQIWKIAEKSINIWNKITKDNIKLENKYKNNGSLEEINFVASNFKFRKTFNK